MSVIDGLWLRISRPVPARPVGFVRIVIGIAAAIRAVEGLSILWPLTKPETLRLPYADWLPSPAEPVVAGLVAVWLASAVVFAMGWKTRAAGTVLFVSIGLVLLLDQQAYSNHLYLMALVILLLTIGDAGAALSLDARRRPKESVAAGPVLLLRLQISIVYVFAAVTKLNAGFLGGGVLAAQLGTGFVPVPDWIRVRFVMMSLAAAVVVIEIFLAVALWRKAYRPAALVLGLVFHASIFFLMDPAAQLLVFAMEMLALYLLFLDLAPRSRAVVFDDACSYCRRIARRFEALDWLQVHEFTGASNSAQLAKVEITGEEAQEAVWIVHGAERKPGFEALGRVAESLPVSYLLAPVHRILRAPGGRWYRRAARRRNCRSTALRVTS